MALEAARVPRPGRIIDRELKERGWSQRDLAEIMGRPVQAINEIIGGAKQITPATARELGEAFGTSAEFWMNLETAYRLHLARQKEAGGTIARRSKIYGILPVKEAIRRAWIPFSASLEELEANACSFLQIRSPDETPKFDYAISRRHSAQRDPEATAQIAMLRRAETLVSRQKPGKFDLRAFKEAIPRLLELASRLADVARVPEFLLDAGVYFAIVPSLTQSFLDGATFSFKKNPVIVLTLRYDRIDNFWFTLMHEVAHVASGHDGVHLDNRIESTPENREEKQADQFATNWLVPHKEFDAFKKRTAPYFSREKIIAFSGIIGRHPGIILGQLHHERVVAYSHSRQLLERVSPFLKEWIDRSGPPE